jgi:hypothetical protein
MKRQLVFLVLMFYCNILSYSYTDEYLKKCAEERIFDSTAVSFDEFEGGKRFVDKFALNKEELKMIGIWGFDNFVCTIPENRKYGPGIAITFYPNRCFRGLYPFG